MNKINGIYKPALLLFAAVFAVMLVFNFATPMLCDDYYYSFSWVDGSRITEIGQIIPSIMVHRLTNNGRSFAHMLAQLFLFLPKPVFNIFNAANCLVLMYIAFRFFGGSFNRKSTCVLLCGVLAVWNYMPDFGGTFLWLTGSCNYSWGISFLALFVFIYAADYLTAEKNCKCSRFPKALKVVFFILIAVIAGGYSENGSVAAIFAAVLFLVLRYIRDRKIDLVLIIGLAAALVSFWFMMSSPSEINGRAGEFSFAAIAKNVQLIVDSTKAKLLPLFCAYFILLALNFKSGRKEVNISSFVLFLSAMGSLAAFSLAAYFSDRHFTYTVMFIIIACQMLLSDLLERDDKMPALLISVTLAVLFCFNFFSGAIDIGALYMNSRVRATEIADGISSGNDIIEITTFYQSSRYSPVLFEDISEDPENWMNTGMARYYGVGSIVKK